MNGKKGKSRMKEKISAFARDLGFDIRFVKSAAFHAAWHRGETAHITMDEPHLIMADVRSVIVLFAPYMPSDAQIEGRMNVSEYYRISNASYGAAKQVAAFAQAQGVKAELSWRLNARQTALLSGGSIGKNGFYYHERWGSLVCIHTILTDRDWGEDYAPGKAGCANCGACIAACPVGAVHDHGVEMQKCMRQHMNDTVPETMRAHIYQLFGCEKCQLCCPMNHITQNTPQSFSVETLLSGPPMEELITLCGKNMARPKRVVSQALLYAGAKKMKPLLPLVQKYRISEYNSVKTHAEWALKCLNDEQ
jgi:epoxyqueuosine reductase QueG